MTDFTSVPKCWRFGELLPRLVEPVPPKINHDRRRLSTACSWFLPMLAAFFLWACDGSDSASLPADPRVILQAHLSHGIGENPLESPLTQDSLAAAMIVRARECAPADLLRGLAPDTAHGGRLLERVRSDGLIDIREGQACTTFPILVNEEQATYAMVTYEVAEDALKVLSSDLIELAGLVDERGWKESTPDR